MSNEKIEIIGKEALEVLKVAKGHPLTIKRIVYRLKKREVIEETIKGLKLTYWLKKQPGVVYNRYYLSQGSFMLKENAERYLPIFLLKVIKN